MEDNAHKLAVLSRVARALNGAGVTWAVGASLLLYFHSITDAFHDIDLMTTNADAPKVKQILCAMGALAPPNPSARYQTKHFYEFTVDGVEIDVMADFAIVQGGNVHDCALAPEHIDAHRSVNGEDVPLQTLSAWREYYRLMGRREKMEMIDRRADAARETR